MKDFKFIETLFEKDVHQELAKKSDEHIENKILSLAEKARAEGHIGIYDILQEFKQKNLPITELKNRLYERGYILTVEQIERPFFDITHTDDLYKALNLSNYKVSLYQEIFSI